MLYCELNKTIETLMPVLCGEVNDVYICKNIAAVHNELYVLLIIKDREAIKNYLQIMQTADVQAVADNPCAGSFSHGENMCFLYAYSSPRKLFSFLSSQITTQVKRESVCLRLITECILSPFPYPVQYLLLNEENIHLNKDDSVYFTFYPRLDNLDTNITQADCTKKLAMLCIDILSSGSKKSSKSFELLQKKLRRDSFGSYADLYQDIKYTCLPQKKLSLITRFKNFWLNNKDKLFKFLLFLSVFLLITALLAFVTQLIFGEIPFFRLFDNMFKQIGNQSLISGERIQ